jgi:rubrerythrin
MSMIKRGTSSTSVVISSSVYVCPSCGHTEMAEGDIDNSKACPVCKTVMTPVSAQAAQAENTEK